MTAPPAADATAATAAAIERLKTHPSADDLALIDISRAAVLVPLIVANNTLHVILTVRSSRLRSHAAEVALPGGKRDPHDTSLVHTALREAEEEIGLAPDSVSVLTSFPSVVSKHRLLVSPVVALVPSDFVPTINPDEVDHSFSLPLSTFLSNSNHRSSDISWLGSVLRVHFFVDPQLPAHVVFGMTARILIDVALVAYHSVIPCEFVPFAPDQERDEVLVWLRAHFRHRAKDVLKNALAGRKRPKAIATVPPKL